MRTHPLKTGSILYASWGYDQTNVDFYKVQELRGKSSAIIVPIGSKRVRSEFAAEYVTADPDCIREWDVLLGDGAKHGKLKRIRPDGTVKLCSHAWAHPNTDDEHYETAAGFGH